MGKGGDFEGAAGLQKRTTGKDAAARALPPSVKVIRIGDRVVDVSQFGPRHPGGKVLDLYMNEVRQSRPSPTALLGSLVPGHLAI